MILMYMIRQRPNETQIPTKNGHQRRVSILASAVRNQCSQCDMLCLYPGERTQANMEARGETRKRHFSYNYEFCDKHKSKTSATSITQPVEASPTTYRGIIHIRYSRRC